MADEGPTSEIKDELKAILGTADWATLTERKVRDLLCDKFGNVAQTQSVRSLIADEINATLQSQAQEDDFSTEGPASQVPLGKRKSKAESLSEPPLKAQKTEESSATPKAEGSCLQSDVARKNDDDDDETDALSLPLMLSDNRRADLSVFKGKQLVNIREYYEKNGEMLPGSKGIALTTDQFKALKDGAEQINIALEAADESFRMELSNRRVVRINVFKGSAMVDIREMYEKEGKELPGKKGISLKADQWSKLKKGLKILEAAKSSD